MPNKVKNWDELLDEAWDWSDKCFMCAKKDRDLEHCEYCDDMICGQCLTQHYKEYHPEHLGELYGFDGE